VALAGGDTRAELTVPGELMVLDIAPDGRWLTILEDGFYGIGVRQPGRETDLDLSWLDLSWGVSLSPDRQTAVFSNGHGGANYTVVTRRLDGSPISTLGEGEALGFSPDGAWVAAKIPTPPELVLYPTGAGAPRRLVRGSIERYEKAQWFPDGKSLLVTGSEPSRPLRAFRQSIDGGPPEPVTPEGIYGTLSPRGDAILALDAGATWKLYPLDGGEPRVVPGLGPLEEIAAWYPDGDAVG
jgi:dipeptidyl aminopeptidase/acylaminoacyl peptidase